MPNKTFNHILLMGRPNIQGVPETLSDAIEYLQTQEVAIVLEKTAATLVDAPHLPVAEPDDLPSDIDLILVVGGDGSLLSAAHLAISNDLPVLGIHKGRLGFLTDIYPTGLDKIGHILKGQYQQQDRYFLQAELIEDNQVMHHGLALNEVVLSPGETGQMIEFNTYINERLVYKQRADGTIVATPTGSTAYALSAGGPILHPDLEAIVLVPMFPHTLSSRPIVVDNNCQIRIEISETNHSSPAVSFDGQNQIPIRPGGKLLINKYEKQLKIIHPEDYGYFKTLREKLGWEKHASRN